MFISIGFSPNLTKDDFTLALKHLFDPGSWHDNAKLDMLITEFAKAIEVDERNLFPSISGRSAIYDTLKLFGVGDGDEVIMQTFNCVAVTNSILWTGAKPVYVDIEKSTLNLDFDGLTSKVTDKTKAIIVQHTFGLPFSKMNELINFAKQRNIYVIEDCAHALGAKIDGKYVGTFADAGVFSFGRDKVVSSVFGGVLYLSPNNREIVDAAEVLFTNKRNAPNRWILKQLLHPILSYVMIKTYNFLSIGKILHFLFQKINVLSRASDEKEKRCEGMPNWIECSYPGVLADLATSQLHQLPIMNQRRFEIAAQYAKNGILSVQEEPSTKVERVWLRYSLYVADPQRYHQAFKAGNVILGDWYDQVIGPKEVNLAKTGYEAGATPKAEDVCAHVVNLPVYPRMTDDEVLHVIMVYKSMGKVNNE